MMKLFKKSANGKMVQLGEDTKTASWYYVTDKVKDVLPSLKEGEEITIKFEKRGGSNYLLFMAKGKVDVPAETKKEEPKPEAEVKVEKKEEPKRYGKPPAEQNSIKRQAIGKMTAQTLIAMQGLINPDNVLTLIDKVYDKYSEKVG
jgi:hypothetical protein